MRQKTANWVGLLIILFLLPLLIFTLFSGCKPSDTPVTQNPPAQTPSTDNPVGSVIEVAGMVVWTKYVVSASATAVGWQLKADDGKTYVLDNPPDEVKSKCGMCKFRARMRVEVSFCGETFAPDQCHARIVEVLELKEELCDH